MNRLFISLVFLFTFLFMPCSLVFPGEVSSIHLVCDEWPGFTNKDGTGVYWEIIKAVYEPAGIKVITNVVPWKRAILMVYHNESDAIVGDYYSKAQSGRSYLYPNWHISVEDPIVAIFKRKTLPNWHLQGVKALDGRTLGWIRGYDYDPKGWWDVSVKHHGLSTIHSGLKMLIADRLDVLLDYASAIKDEAQKIGMDMERTYELHPVKLGEKLFLKFSKTERSKTLIKIFDSRMDLMTSSHEVVRIYKKWGHPKDKFGKDRYETQ